MSDCTCGAGSAYTSGSCSNCTSGTSQYSGCTSGCGGNCSGANCGAGCGPCGGCGGNCGGCDGNCGTSCNTACAVDCTSDCTGGCLTECGKQCTGKTQAENFKNLKLEKKFIANNIQHISNFVDYEIQRRGLTTDTVTFTQKAKLDDTIFNKIITNLEKSGLTISESKAIEKKKGLKALGLDIIKKATELYNTDVVDH